MVQKVSAVATALSLNPAIFHALAGLDVSKADPATQYYVKRTLLEFRLAGVDKDDATRVPAFRRSTMTSPSSPPSLSGTSRILR
jgi:Zn-dependent oligopeptidase